MTAREESLHDMSQSGYVSVRSMQVLMDEAADIEEVPLRADVTGTTWAAASDFHSAADEAPLRDKVRLLEEMVSALVEENKRLTRLLEASPTFCPTCGKK
jgi:hypothetical protein